MNTTYRNTFKPFSLTLRGEIREFTSPQVMGIVNVTPDSLYSGSRVKDLDALKRRVEDMTQAGATMIDIGGCSTRPGAAMPSAAEELDRVIPAIEAVRTMDSSVIISVDTFRAAVARESIAAGADIINDVSGGKADDAMLPTVAELKVPYVLTHSRGDSATMQSLTEYPEGVTAGVIGELSTTYRELRLMGVADIIIDPGFGFAKTLQQNYTLLNELAMFRRCFDAPLLVGCSRKSMITRLLEVEPSEALNGTTVANTLALERGAAILRVHDVAEAVETVKIVEMTHKI